MTTQLTQFGLTVLSALVLAACSGGGGGSTPAPQQPKPQPEIKQPETKQPETKQPETKQPETKQPETKQPETKQPEIKQPETKQPEMNQPQQPPKAEQPTPPMADQPKMLSDQDVFKTLNQNGKDIGGKNPILSKLHLEGKDITLLPLNNTIDIYGQKISTLRDSNGTLLGYYGYARVLEQKKDVNSPDGQLNKHYQLALLDLAPDVKAVQPTKHMTYRGTMYYHYLNAPQKVIDASVDGYYSPETKRITIDVYYLGEIDANVRENPNIKSVLVTNESGSKENIVGKLYDKKTNQPIGELTGGLYGNYGEILAGKTKSTEEQGDKAWVGTFGAKGENRKPF